MNNKIILCFSGTGRSIKYTYENIKKNVINDLSPAHIFIVTEKQQYYEQLIEYFSIFENITIKVVKNVGFVDKNLKFFEHTPWNKPETRLNYLNFIYKRYELSKLVRNYVEKHKLTDYKYIYSRLDVMYKYPISGQIAKVNTDKKVYLPNFHHWLGGYNDRFVLANYKNFITYLEIYPYLQKYSEVLPLHSERITRLHFKENNLKLGIIRLPFSRIRSNGEVFDDVEQFDTRFIAPIRHNKHVYKESPLDSLRLMINKVTS